jgi:hypothetical protein
MTPADPPFRLSSSVPLRPPAPAPDSGPHGAGALEAVHEMLERLESVTDAGRQHLMLKIVTVLDAHPMAGADPCIRARVADLRREAGKAAPDGVSFANVARPLVSLLAGLAAKAP